MGQHLRILLGLVLMDATTAPGRVDTPKTIHPNNPAEYFGKEASAFTRRLARMARMSDSRRTGSLRSDR
jgi:hypothetical protein